VNWLDGAIIVLILWFTFSAFQAGFIRETVTIMGAVVGIALAGIFYQDLADDVLTFIESETLAPIVAFGTIFGISSLAGQALALVLKPTVHALQLGVFDQMAGAIFGFAKALLFIQIFIIVFVTYPKWGLDKTIEQSSFGSIIAERTTLLVKMLPDEFNISVDHFLDEI
jgi:uncharacterized membrane protein required for colicin V production